MICRADRWRDLGAGPDDYRNIAAATPTDTYQIIYYKENGYSKGVFMVVKHHKRGVVGKAVTVGTTRVKQQLLTRENAL